MKATEERYKYPRTPHLPWSRGTADDKTLKNDDHFKGKRVIVTLKMDGECTSIYSDYFHARSLDSESHPSQNWVRKLQGDIGWMIPSGIRICGENLYAKHTVEYTDLTSFFTGFSLWNGDLCYDWETTSDTFDVLDIQPVPVIYDDVYNMMAIQAVWGKYSSAHEGYVVRIAEQFNYADFDTSVAKFVKPEFREALNQNTKHWKQGVYTKNKLK